MTNPDEKSELLNAGLTVKEWLLRMDNKLDTIDSKLDGKANTADVEKLDKRVTELEKGQRSWRTIIVTVFLALIVVGVGAWTNIDIRF